MTMHAMPAPPRNEGWPRRSGHCPHCGATDAWTDGGQLWRTTTPVPRLVRWVIVSQCGICRHRLVAPLPRILSDATEYYVALWRACPPDAPAS